MYKKQNRHGFSLLEVMVAVTIAVILGSFTLFGMTRFFAEKKVEKDVITLWKELCALRSKALKTETCYFVIFNIGNNSYQVWKDGDGDCAFNANDDVSIRSPLRANITFGLPDNLSGSGPGGGANPAASIEGNWTVAFEIKNDYIGTINTGRICLENPSISKIGYCILVGTNSQNVLLFKWSGSTWYEM